MDSALGAAYKGLEDDIKAALEEHHGNQSVVSTALKCADALSRPAFPAR